MLYFQSPLLIFHALREFENLKNLKAGSTFLQPHSCPRALHPIAWRQRSCLSVTEDGMPGRYLGSPTPDQISIQVCSGLKLFDWTAVRVGLSWVCDSARGDSWPFEFTGPGLSSGRCRAETLPACCSPLSGQPPLSAFLHFLFRRYGPKPAPAHATNPREEVAGLGKSCYFCCWDWRP